MWQWFLQSQYAEQFHTIGKLNPGERLVSVEDYKLRHLEAQREQSNASARAGTPGSGGTPIPGWFPTTPRSGSVGLTPPSRWSRCGTGTTRVSAPMVALDASLGPVPIGSPESESPSELPQHDVASASPDEGAVGGTEPCPVFASDSLSPVLNLDAELAASLHAGSDFDADDALALFTAGFDIE